MLVEMQEIAMCAIQTCDGARILKALYGLLAEHQASSIRYGKMAS